MNISQHCNLEKLKVIKSDSLPLEMQYEKREEKADPAHARRHHVEAQVAEAAALGLGGYALYERHEANKIHKIQKQEAKLSGKQKHKHRK